MLIFLASFNPNILVYEDVIFEKSNYMRKK
jgi:hypothetical protein